MRNILLPTDFSEESYNGLRYAINMFGPEGCQFVLMNAYPVQVASGIEYHTVPVNMEEIARNNVKKTEQNLREQFSDLDLDFKIVTYPGSLPSAVDSTVEEYDIDLIVMGTSGTYGLRRFLRGSNSSDLAITASCPQLIIPAEYKFEGLKKVAFSFDFQDSALKPEMNPLLELCTKYGANLTILNVYGYGDTQKLDTMIGLQMMESLSQHIDTNFHFEENINVEQGIQDYVNENATDMLVAVSHDRGFLKRIFNPSLTRRLAMHPTVPLLILHS